MGAGRRRWRVRPTRSPPSGRPAAGGHVRQRVAVAREVPRLGLPHLAGTVWRRRDGRRYANRLASRRPLVTARARRDPDFPEKLLSVRAAAPTRTFELHVVYAPTGGGGHDSLMTGADRLRDGVATSAFEPPVAERGSAAASWLSTRPVAGAAPRRRLASARPSRLQSSSAMRRHQRQLASMCSPDTAGKISIADGFRSRRSLVYLPHSTVPLTM